jgi:hypothetical protein
MTAEIKKGRYVHCRCTGVRGRCGNTYIRDEALGDLRGTTIRHIQIPEPVAEQIAGALREADGCLEREQTAARQRLEDRRRKVLAKLDRGYEDCLEGRITEAFSDAQVGAVGRGTADGRGRDRPAGHRRPACNGHRCENFGTREKRRESLRIAGSEGTAAPARNGALELHVRSRTSLSHLQ